MIRKPQSSLAICITTILCACATEQLDLTTNATPIYRIATIEDKYWQSIIEEDSLTLLSF